MTVNENELERFEAELRSIRPAPAPADFLQRLKTARPALLAERRAESAFETPPAGAQQPAAPGRARPPKPALRTASWLLLVLRWGIPATTALVVGALVWHANRPAGGGPATASAPVKADDVQIDQQLVSTFDAVAPLPSGEPVRFRCRQWMDEMVLRDSKQGVEVTQRVPRLEVVAVSFDTY